jgi:anti-sigma-K factor RskA
MSPTESNQPTRHCGDDVAAYALGALAPGEVDTFRRHLEQCAVCRDELAAFEQIVRELPLAADQYRAPKTLRASVLQALEDEPTLGPAAKRRRARPHAKWFSAIPRPALALASLVAVLAIAFGAFELGSGSSGSSATKVFNAQVSGSRGTAHVRVSNGHGELVVHDFAPPPRGKIYEVWLVRPHRAPQPTPALFSVTAKGDGAVDVPGSLRGVKQVLVTPEPAGGSQAPTHTPVIAATLT